MALYKHLEADLVESYPEPFVLATIMGEEARLPAHSPMVVAEAEAMDLQDHLVEDLVESYPEPMDLATMMGEVVSSRSPVVEVVPMVVVEAEAWVEVVLVSWMVLRLVVQDDFLDPEGCMDCRCCSSAATRASQSNPKPSWNPGQISLAQALVAAALLRYLTTVLDDSEDWQLGLRDQVAAPLLWRQAVVLTC